MSDLPGSRVSAEDLREQAATALGALDVLGLTPMFGGASRSLWAFDARSPDGVEVPLVLLITKGTAEREWQVLGAAHAHGVRVAEPLWRTPDGAGVVMRRLAGEAIPGRIFRDESLGPARDRLLGQMAAALAVIHRLPLADVPAIGGRPAGAEAELDALEAELDLCGDPHPALELGLRWLRRRLPAEREPVVVHGDFRLGNMLIDGDGLAAVLDWELVHAGDPAEDLGWMCARTWRFGRDDRPAAGLGSRAELLEAYREAGGTAEIDLEQLRFWEMLGNLRWGVLTLRQLYEHSSGQRPSLELAAIGRRTCEAEWDLLAMVD